VSGRDEGVFHHERHELHGITVVVDTRGPQVYVGRCHDLDDHEIVLMDVDVHHEGDGGRSKQDYIRQAAQFGVWRKHATLRIPRSEVTSVSRLGDVIVD
jgi:hypothetical protein